MQAAQTTQPAFSPLVNLLVEERIAGIRAQLSPALNGLSVLGYGTPSAIADALEAAAIALESAERIFLRLVEDVAKAADVRIPVENDIPKPAAVVAELWRQSYYWREEATIS